MMNVDSCVPIKDQKERQNPLLEVISVEKQLLALIHSKGLLQTEIQDFYLKARSGYENIILNDHDVELELHDVEYSLWKLHYKHINEFRKRIRQTSANTNQSSIDCHMERFKSFLSEASEFYHDLITKLRRRHELPEDPFACDKGDGLCAVEPMKLHKCQYSCHRFLVCLGDLARYRELCKKLDLEKHNWSVAATYYFKATSVWPDSGNPQNQLALLATYVGDDFIALYHCIRSLAAKEPFPDAWDNLILLFEKNRSSHLHSLAKEAQFNFSNPCQRSTSLIESQSSSGSSNNDALEAPDRISSVKCDLWLLFVRMISFFFIESSFEEFPCMFASTMRELDSLLALDDTELIPALDSYQHMDSARTGPYRALQMVSVLIFIVNSLTKSLDQKESKEKNYVQQPILIQSALTATFICMGRLVERCLKSNNPTELSPLLPAVLVFVEWFVGTLEKLIAYGAYEKVRSAISYFFDAFVDLLNRLDKSDGEFKYQDHTALWEDYELRGFSPVSQGHGSLDFTSDPKIMGKFDCINACRPNRIFCAAKKIVGRSYGSQKLILYDDLSRKFYTSESKKLMNQRAAEVAESWSNFGVKETVRENGNEPFENANSIAIEEEVILFKPITRHNSAPLYASITDDEVHLEDANDQTTPSDESLCRAASLFVAQNKAQIGNFRNKPFKLHEPLPKDTASYPAGPPSLSAWVLNRESLNTEKEKGKKDFYKPGLSPIEEIASVSLPSPSISETGDSLIDSLPLPYSAPMPSAPLLPDDAIWFNANAKETNGILGASPLSSYANLSPTHGQLSFGYQPVLGMSSSEWLYQYTNQNLNRVSNQVWPVHFYSPGRLGNYFYGHDGSRFALCDRWGNPLSPNQMVFLESPQLHSGSPLLYGADEERRERLFQNYQRPSPYGCGGAAATELRAEQPPPLLHYLKEKERLLQQPSQLKSPTYMGQ
ncbi:Protein SMG7L like [Actinidia chinensis var. chinensis]|uniref:Protein SMG7L like n=1 Tax=Actinidia chinensis var. chinensis TaxID=1590841 RepID=A0A2R6QLE1_ACTCC|nr:Protein SMG7L like [Actinidia chinensis var. chinensis]